jgi:hypothetical protein
MRLESDDFKGKQEGRKEAGKEKNREKKDHIWGYRVFAGAGGRGLWTGRGT